MEEILKQFKKGNRNYEIVKRLIDSGGGVVSCRELIATSVFNPMKVAILNKPEIYKKEKDLLEKNVNQARRKIDGFNIVKNKKLDGYYMVAL